MSQVYRKPEIQAFTAEADLSAKQYHLVKWGSDKTKVALCGNAEKPMGVLMNAPASGEVAEVAVAGGAKVKVNASAAVTLGASVASAADGFARDAVAGEWSLGTFADAGGTGEIIPISIDLHELDN